MKTLIIKGEREFVYEPIDDQDYNIEKCFKNIYVDFVVVFDLDWEELNDEESNIILVQNDLDPSKLYKSWKSQQPNGANVKLKIYAGSSSPNDDDKEGINNLILLIGDAPSRNVEVIVDDPQS